MRRRQPASRVRLKPETVWRCLNQLNLSQNKLAQRVGISSGYLSQLMTGTRCPSAEVRVALMETLEVTEFDDLFVLEIVSSSDAENVPVATGALAFGAEGPREVQRG